MQPPPANVFSMVINFLMQPFPNILGPPTNFNSSLKLGGTVPSENSVNSLGELPLGLLRSGATCGSFIYHNGENQLKMSTIPRGYCWTCCEVDKQNHVKFMLYTKNNPIEGVQITPYNQAGGAKTAGVNDSIPTEIFIHGFSEISPGDSGKNIKDAYLSREEDYNVILLDWSELATFPWYSEARQNVKIVAQMLKKFLEIFNDSGEIPISNVHVIGFSLGSHVASFTGKFLRQGLKIPRITSLDPAFPEFSLRDSSRRLTRTDAEYIDVIHTDAGILGIPIPVGHADFYPNDGHALQPGCRPSLDESSAIDSIIACSHVRAWQLYAESIRNSNAFPATRCPEFKGVNKKCNFTLDAHMGLTNKNAFGKFYLKTNGETPYTKNVDEQII